MTFEEKIEAAAFEHWKSYKGGDTIMSFKEGVKWCEEYNDAIAVEVFLIHQKELQAERERSRGLVEVLTKIRDNDLSRIDCKAFAEMALANFGDSGKNPPQADGG